jgi:fatty-acyl-CoA synthase
MQSTMMDFPLTVPAILRHGERVHARARAVTLTPDGTRSISYAELGVRARKLASALAGLGVKPGDRVATFAWNNQEHLEAYFAIPSMGAVLHTLNLRLFADQVAFIANHAEDQVVILEASLAPLWVKFAAQLKTVKHLLVFGPGDVSMLGKVLRYEDLIDAATPMERWPELEERSAAAMCYTSGTTGNPKGVVYSHRSTYLHSLACCTAGAMGLTDRDRVLPVVPMFHANAWGLPYACFLAGADLILPGPYLQAERLCNAIQSEGVTFLAGVPTVWAAALEHADATKPDLSTVRMMIVGGSAVPRSLIERFEKNHGVRVVQAWGMTETSPLGAVASPPRGVSGEEAMTFRSKAGRMVPGVELRLVDDAGTELPWDGTAIGEIQARGAWVTARYHQEPSPEKFDHGWLRTGDVGTLDRFGFIEITDRSKDVVKSGGEWISSVALENALVGHPEVLEAAVVGVPDPRWGERPLACIVRRPGKQAAPAELRQFLEGKVARWWLPERFAFVAEIPKTSVGKIDKKEIRARLQRGELAVVEEGKPPEQR